MIPSLAKLRCIPRIPHLSLALPRTRPPPLQVQAVLATHPPHQIQLKGLLNRTFCSKFQNLPPTVTYEEVVEALEDSTALVIDVRQPEELEKDGVIPGALNIPLGDLEVGLV